MSDIHFTLRKQISRCLILASMLMTGHFLHGQKHVSFNRDIRPILSENCYACHGPDAEARKADLRLDLEEWAFRDRKEGGPAIIPGDPQQSPLYKRVTHKLKSEIMPPPDSNKVLTAEEKELIRQWIEEGAKWEGHWAFIKPEKQQPPKVDWGNNSIDKFTFAAMQEHGLKPNQEADRPTLARRLSLDLTGLPPTPELVDRFVKDRSKNAYEKLVDTLLASPAYGEQQARFWLDAARYSDTHGLHLDNYREIWPYRDWVVKSFNENKPYDQFTVEQIAGDLLPNATQDQRLGTGFNRCNPTTSEGGAIEDEYRAIYAKNRVETTATVFMGLTMGCASCHDHKFDPLTMKDFYKFSAFFNNIDGPIMDGNIYDTKPVVVIPLEHHREAWKRIQPEYESLLAQLKEVKKANAQAFDAWLETENPLFADDLIQPGYTLARREEAEEDKPEKKTDDTVDGFFQLGESVTLPGSLNQFGTEESFTLTFEFKTPDKEWATEEFPLLSKFDGDRGIRITLMPGSRNQPDCYRFKVELIHSLKANDLISFQTESWRYLSPRPGRNVTAVLSYDGSREAAGVTMGAPKRQIVDENSIIDNLTGDFDTDAPLTISAAETEIPVTKVQFFKKLIPDYALDHYSSAKRIRTLFDKDDSERRDRDTNALRDYFFDMIEPEYSAIKVQEAKLEPRYRFIYDQAVVSLAIEEAKGPAKAHMLERGQYDKPGEEVFANVPAALGAFPNEGNNNRLDLAKWLIDPDNPLTARVTVNRFWQNLFGTGIVATSEDFGTMGENPTHPELLDWLAVQFMESGWKVKEMIKLMVMSATYRQSSHIDPEKYNIDSANRYLARGPRYRLDGEVLRDSALFVSGLLNEAMGGPGVKPYQPEGIWNAVAYSGSNTRFYYRDEGEALYRRSLYTFWKRTAPPPNMVVFDVPSRENCSVRRERTNTPLQALTLMNDPQYVEAARNLAQRVLLGNKKPVTGCIRQMYRLALGINPPQKHEKILTDSYSRFHDDFSQEPENARKLANTGESSTPSVLDPVELASLTLVANQIMNLDSFVNKY